MGPNGSGKTSLIRVICGAAEPERGSVDWVRTPRLGYVPQSFSLDRSKTPLELIGYEKAEYLGRCGVGRKLWDSPSGNLSGGGRLTAFPGNYSAYAAQVEANRVHEQREYAKLSREVRELTIEIANRRQWYKKAHKDAGQNDFRRRKAKKHARQFLAKESALERLM